MACQTATTPLSTAVAEAPLAIAQKPLRGCHDTRPWRGQLLHFATRRTDSEGSAILHEVLGVCQPDINAHMWQDCPLGYACYRVTGIGTALHEVARTGRPELAAILLQQEADVSIRDSCGQTALEVAVATADHTVRDLLQHMEGK